MTRRNDLRAAAAGMFRNSDDPPDAFGGLGGPDDVQPMPRLEIAEDLVGGSGYPVLPGDYTGIWGCRRTPLAVSTAVGKSTPVFTKRYPAVVETELERLAGA